MMFSFVSWLFMLLLTTIFFEINVVLVSGHCQSDQQGLLLQLKNTLNFNSSLSLKLVKWNQSLDCCRWKGVTCDAKGHVTDLDLSNDSISGGIDNSSSLFNLQHLQSLNLANNHFNSSFPSRFDKLSNLSYLNLSYAGFTGQIPEVMNLTQLVSLDFSSNSFSGPIPSFSFAKNLTHLNLAHNKLIGSILSTKWSSLSKLESINLRDNALSGTLHLSSILNLADLSTLDLSFNNLSINATFSSTTSFPRIHTLKLASCKLKRFPNFLREQSQLSILDLSANQIDGEIPDWVWTPSSLSYLNLSHNFLVNLQGPLQVASYSLTVLDLHDNKLQGQLPKFSEFLAYVDYSSNNFSSFMQLDNHFKKRFKPFMSPSFVFLSNNNLQGSIPESICNATNLQVLDLSNNYLSGTIPQCLTGMESLKVLDLSRNNLSGNISDQFSSDCLLQTLNLNGNHLKGTVPRSLANCAILEVLNLGNNQINDTFPCHLKKISNLRVLVLKYNNFHGVISCPDDNTSWPLLQIVDLASNHFRGELPYHWLRTWKAMMVSSNDLKVLVFEGDAIFGHRSINIYDTLNPHKALSTISYTFQAFYYQDAVTVTIKGSERQLVKILSLFISIDFSCNKFEGRIPEVLGEFKALYALNLSHNGFTGLIPSSLGNLRHLESLDLSSNNLSGEIPQQLGDLNFLAVLNLSHNQLEGRIPSGRQFQTFSEDSFKDNKGLCGMPLKENCSVNAPPPKNKHSGDGTHIDWNFLSVELGFVFGLGIVILPLTFYKRWRMWYSKGVDGLLSRFFPQLNQRSRNRGKGALRSTKT